MKPRVGWKPADIEFIHDPGCRTSSAQPEWIKEDTWTWTRTCSCRTDRADVPVDRPPPPDPTTLQHALDPIDDQPCEGRARTVWEDSHWQLHCGRCGTRQHFWPYTPHVLADGSVEPLPVGATVVYPGASR